MEEHELLENQESIERQAASGIEIWDNAKRAKILIIVFYVILASFLMSFLATLGELHFYQSLEAGEYIDDSAYDSHESLLAMVAVAHMGLYIGSVVVFLNWFRRAYGNLHRAGTPYVAHSESMAVWFWFIPIVSFFRPFQLMQEIWRETQERIQEYDPTYDIQNAKGLVGTWWALHIIANFLGNYVLRSTLKSPDLSQLITTSQVSLFSDVLELIEAILVILIVRKLSGIETKLADEVVKAGGQVISK
ncbi:MAG: DUF4328 domain-containing protein [Bacteroidota bacterium]